MRWLSLLSVLLIALPAIGAEKLSETKLVELVQKKYPGVKWDTKSMKKADFNCDGKGDFALLGKEGSKVAVAVVLGPLTDNSKILITRLLVGKNSQDSLCSPRAKLSIEDQDYDPAENFDGVPLPGFRRSKTCKGINVSDGESDSFHFFWNHDLKSLQWWRL